MVNGAFTCYAPGCAKKTWIDLQEACTNPGHTVKCSHCDKEWATSFSGRTCCSLVILFVSVELEGKKSLSKLQRFKIK